MPVSILPALTGGTVIGQGSQSCRIVTEFGAVNPAGRGSRERVRKLVSIVYPGLWETPDPRSTGTADLETINRHPPYHTHISE